MKVAFYGSTNFSLSILKKLNDFHNQGKIQVEYVVSQSTKELQFSKKIVENPIVRYCIENDIKHFTPSRLKDSDFLLQIEPLEVDLVIVAAYGKIIPLSLINKSKYGFINFHGSILPKYRGAVPVQFSILNHDLENSGISIIKMDAGMDDGEILKKIHVSYSPEEFQDLTSGELMENLAELSYQTLEKEFDYIFNPGKWDLEEQSEAAATYCYVSDMAKEKLEILFEDTFLKAHGKIMSANPEPKAWVIVDGKKYNILRSRILSPEINLEKSNKLSLLKFEKNLYIELMNGFLQILEIQPDGKKVMDATSFINGYLR